MSQVSVVLPHITHVPVRAMTPDGGFKTEFPYRLGHGFLEGEGEVRGVSRDEPMSKCVQLYSDYSDCHAPL